MSLNLALFILVVVFVVGWFAIGTQYNVRKGHEAMRWLQEGLPVIGEKTTLRWLGSSVVELKIQQAKPPFRNAVILFVLEPRDVSVTWAFARLRGRRDLFIFRAGLLHRPEAGLEVLDPSSWSTGTVARQIKTEQWNPISVPPPLVAYARPNSPRATDFLATSALEGCPLVRLAFHQADPNFEVQWPLDPLRKHSARDVLEILRRVAERV